MGDQSLGAAFLNFLDKLPIYAFKLGLAFVLLAGCVLLGLQWQYVAVETLKGQVAEVAPVAFIIGVGLILVGIVFHIPSVVASFRGWLASNQLEMVEAIRLIDNLRFLDVTPKLLLLHCLGQPEGRFEGDGEHSAFRRLYELGLIIPEKQRSFPSGEWGPMYVARSIWRERDTIKERLIAETAPRLADSAILSNPQKLKKVVEDLLVQEGGNRFGRRTML